MSEVKHSAQDRTRSSLRDKPDIVYENVRMQRMTLHSE